MRFYQRLYLLLSLTIVVTGTSLAASHMPAPSNTTVDLGGIVATVNDDIITSAELQQQIKIATAQLKANHITIPPQHNLHQSVLQQMINRDLQLQVAQHNNITASPAKIKTYVKALAKRQNISVTQWRGRLHKQGLTNAEINKMVHDQLVIMIVQRSALAASIKPTTAEQATIKKQLQQTQQSAQYFNLEDINIALPNRPSPKQLKSAQSTATQLISRLNQGQSIKASQQIQVTAMGWKNENQLPALFVSALQGKQAGDIVGPIKAANGLHLLKINNLRADPTQTPSAAQIEQMAMQQKYMSALNQWLKTLRNNAFINISTT